MSSCLSRQPDEYTVILSTENSVNTNQLYSTSTPNSQLLNHSDKPKRRRAVTKKTTPLTINLTNCKYDIVKECATLFGCKLVEDPLSWHLFWIDTGVSMERVLEMKLNQRINHFPGMHEICRKDHLARNFTRLSRIFPKDYNFFPKTWILPNDWGEFNLFHKSKSRSGPYIAKPDHGCQGKGIFLFKTPDQLYESQSTSGSNPAPNASIQNNPNISGGLIVQSYLSQPCLIDGFKFDLRIYVLVTSISPLRVFVYRDGLARFATDLYHPPTDKNINNTRMHLTNYAINKHSEKFVVDDMNGSKRSLKAVLQFLAESRGVDTDALWNRICDIIVKTILVVQPVISRGLKSWLPSSMIEFQDLKKPTGSNLSSAHSTHSSYSSFSTPTHKPTALPLSGMGSQCFEILGFDIFLDSKMKPWVLEVNHSPSFTCDSPLDREIKSGVITDALNLLNLSAGMTKKLQKKEKAQSLSRLWKAPDLPVNDLNASFTLSKKPVSKTLAVCKGNSLKQATGSSCVKGIHTLKNVSKLMQQSGDSPIDNSDCEDSSSSDPHDTTSCFTTPNWNAEEPVMAQGCLEMQSFNSNKFFDIQMAANFPFKPHPIAALKSSRPGTAGSVEYETGHISQQSNQSHFQLIQESIQNNESNSTQDSSTDNEICHTTKNTSILVDPIYSPLKESISGRRKSTVCTKRLQACQEALAAYIKKYNQDCLAQLTGFEDAHMGQYERIFPPSDTKQLSKYLYLMHEPVTWSSETNSTKARKEHLERKKHQELDQQRKIESWKLRQKRDNPHIQSKVNSLANQTVLDARRAMDSNGLIVSKNERIDYQKSGSESGITLCYKKDVGNTAFDIKKCLSDLKSLPNLSFGSTNTSILAESYPCTLHYSLLDKVSSFPRSTKQHVPVKINNLDERFGQLRDHSQSLSNQKSTINSRQTGSRIRKNNYNLNNTTSGSMNSLLLESPHDIRFVSSSSLNTLVKSKSTTRKYPDKNSLNSVLTTSLSSLHNTVIGSRSRLM
ncbi:hypothetical protein BATDEDRAFT_26123 [Batrachochytrium dendrobatidis JAM81]|uniref:Uncharacterized protein n=2 Tax=Batrachochytrium dendrobatidis TaxID=109871 RepID=F4P746_BATDJ|nr:uncharacterized protein BATDEDRAFT_26123 [Batrachochytrium dendrobatidis JAM81]EGF78801.1 hypothetical protein BATDEDRAFT_26123 [Batrachochytrium dendrobatidis JAM81]OAJ42450.1 hypothetical protein BDEG_25901 [Batrachochytrium dendrobatidis JEL423]|eukprot:XP_006680310.1 hypothetical protein BATDEDRAFT_26123 [Batrachochytrium dendrobatidis JAM81]